MFRSFFTHIRLNGVTEILPNRNIRELVYANMIWLGTLIGFCLYFVCVTVLNITREAHFFYYAAASLVSFYVYYIIIKLKFITPGKYWLIISVNLMVITFDQYMNKQGLNYIYLFAFLPTSMNVFRLKSQKLAIIIFTMFPLVYMIISRHFDINILPAYAQLNEQTLKQLEVVNLVVGFLLFVLFSGYMILNNVYKHQQLVTQSLSLQATLDNSEASIWSIDNNYTLTVANSKYLKSIQHEFTTAPLTCGTNLRTHQIWQTLPENFKTQYKKVLSGNEILEEVKLNGRVYEIKAVPILDKNGDIHGATFGSRDVTVSKKAKELLLRAKRAAEEADGAKARFISNMSHEIRTPLNGIIGTSRILLDENCLPSQQAHLKTLQDLSEHTVQIVNNILDFAKIEAGKAELECKRFNMLRFSDKIKSIFTGTALLKGLKYNIEITGAADVFVKGDEVRLSQVLINLLGNAFKFTEKGSVTLKINIAEHKEKRHYIVDFAVTDTGIGIKSEHTDKIFESFTQADAKTTRKYGGTGLGLSIAKKIVSLMGGTLQVTSTPGVQTTFSFSIRLHMSSAADKQWAKTTTITAANQQPLNILLAEDNKINQMVAKKLLQKWNHKITVANNGKEAADYAITNKPDVVLMDLDMPVMDGYEATEIIKTQFPYMPVIALTAASFDDMDNFLAKKGFSNVVQKPFSPDDLQLKITDAANAAYLAAL